MTDCRLHSISTIMEGSENGPILGSAFLVPKKTLFELVLGVAKSRRGSRNTVQRSEINRIACLLHQWCSGLLCHLFQVMPVSSTYKLGEHEGLSKTPCLVMYMLNFIDAVSDECAPNPATPKTEPEMCLL